MPARQVAIAGGTSLAQAMVAAAVLGLAFELYEPPSQAMIADLTDAETRPRAFGLFGAALAAGGAGAGLLATVLGSVDLRLLFVVDAVTCLACAAVVGLALPPSPRRTSRETVTASPWRDPRLLAMLAAGTCFATLYLQIRVGLPLTMVERGLPAAQFGLLMTVSSVTVVLAQPLLASRLVPGNPFGAMRVGYLVLGAGLAGTGWASGLAGFLATTVVWSLGDVLLLGLPFAIVSGLAPEGPAAATSRRTASAGASPPSSRRSSAPASSTPAAPACSGSPAPPSPSSSPLASPRCVGSWPDSPSRLAPGFGPIGCRT